MRPRPLPWVEHRWRLACLALLCASAPVAAQTPAQTSTALAPSPLPCDDPALLALPAEQLAEHLPRCEKTPAFLLRLGQLHSQQGQYEQAADHIERALMLEPDAPEALLQYAVALAGSGDTLSALNLMGQLRQRPDMPAPLRAELGAVVASWGPRLQGPAWGAGGHRGGASSPASATTVAASVRLGHDSNLQGVSRLSSLTLTLPGETITLPIEPSALPRKGAVLQADLRASHQRQSADGARWGLQAALQQRATPALPGAGSLQAEWQLDYTLAPVWQARAAIKKEADSAVWAPWFSLGMAALHTRSEARYTGRNLSLGLQRTAARCATRWAVDGQQRELHSNPILSGRYAGTSLQWQCDGTPQGGYWLAVLRAGRDRAANPVRPGGHQTQAGLRLQLSAPAPAVLPGGALWLLDADYAYSRDTRGYSPLLDNARQRQTHRLTARIEWQQSVRPGLQAVVGAEAVAQHSTLALFHVRSHGLWLGLRGQW